MGAAAAETARHEWPIGRRDGPATPRSLFLELEPVRDRLPPALLAWSEQRAAALAIGADRVLIDHGVIGEEAYLRAFAARYGCAFETFADLPRAACPLDDAGLIGAAATGILPLRAADHLVFVVAPRGSGLRGVARLLSAQPHARDRLRITSAAHLHRFVLGAGGGAIGHHAATALQAAWPDLSAAPAAEASGPRWAVGAAMALLALALIAPWTTLLALHLLLCLLFLGWIVLRLCGLFLRRPRPPPPAALADAELPVYTVIAAVYREAASVSDLIASLRQLDWPKEKLDLKLVVEADDAETRAAVEALGASDVEVIVAPPVGPRTKPKALNVALPFARGSFTVIYDAEDRPDPNQLRAALDVFLAEGPELACVQAALTIDNTEDSWVARLFTAEYAAHFDVFLPLLAQMRLPLPLGGSSNHFRTEALRAVGAWDPYNVTEDADLGIRLARFGYRATIACSTTYEEAPSTLRPWLRQRTRWFKGWMQTWLVHMRAPLASLRALGPGGFLVLQLVIGGNVLAALVYPVFLAVAAYRLAVGAPLFDAGLGGLHALTLLGGLATTIATGLLGLARRGLLASAWVVLLAPWHWLLLAAAAARAAYQLLRDPYRWEKTEHGLARSSRRDGRPAG
jgi:cellulose synthase/poly-beta-1,6-N-acetylglucosamine synthase-like glycosyltransferase